VVLPRPAHTEPLGLPDLIAGLPAPGSALVDGSSGASVTGVTLDSRSVRAGDLYAALRGANSHGAAFAANAVGSGAAAILTDPEGLGIVREAGVTLPCVVVDDPRAVLGDVAAAVYRSADRRPRLIGVTGTNGKTTTAYLVESALSALGRQTGLIGTVETRVGDERVKSARTTPEATDLHALLALMGERDVDTCIMEVSSHALAQHRVDGVVYDVALFTNLSQDHLDFHATMRGYFLAKASLFTPERSSRAVVCVDDEWGRELAGIASVPVQTLASHGPADWRIEPVDGGPAFVLHGPDGIRLELRSQLPGSFNVVNTALAAAGLVLAGEDPADVARAVLEPATVPGRMELVAAPGGGGPRAVVDYAHTPEAVEAALKALRPETAGPLVVVLGAGGDRDRGKRHAMGVAAATVADLVVVTDDNPRSEDPAAIRAAVRAGADEVATGRAVEVVEVGDRAEAIIEAVTRVADDPTATVAVVGKGHETGQEIAGEVHPFDDRAELAAALAAAVGSHRKDRA
jgi:UDP-N-acetylmuramoyl-L-alanyl-D-glutamate--2,6-diaminopimelate ligase